VLFVGLSGQCVPLRVYEELFVITAARRPQRGSISYWRGPITADSAGLSGFGPKGVGLFALTLSDSAAQRQMYVILRTLK